MMEEKLELKAALFKFAETFGHPDTEEEKNVTKEVYDRYLNLKRLIRKNSANVSFKRTLWMVCSNWHQPCIERETRSCLCF